MKLSRTIAQKIVGEMMNVIPYNINVMNENGIIIGSGEKNRIGHIHEGSLDVIKRKQTVEIYDETPKVKPGINEPIIMNNQVIGVIGITGNPDIVRPFGKLVRVTAALLIEQSKIDEENHNKNLNRQKFYIELCQKSRYDEQFVERAKHYDLDLNKKYTVIVVLGNTMRKDLKAVSQKYPHYIENSNRMIYFTKSRLEIEKIVEALTQCSSIQKISIGTKEEIIANSLKKAELALEVGSKLKPSSLIYTYEQLRLLINLAHKDKEFFVEVISHLNKSGNKIELIQTLQVYIEENGDINQVANRLNIHRNTLNYRLERIHQLTGRNPKNLIELFELLCGLAWK